MDAMEEAFIHFLNGHHITSAASTSLREIGRNAAAAGAIQKWALWIRGQHSEQSHKSMKSYPEAIMSKNNSTHNTI